MGRVMFLIFLVVPLIEIGLFILIGRTIGVWPTLAGVLVTAIVGSAIMRAQGGAILRDIRATLARGELPTRAIADGLMVGAGGLLLMLPGYFTDFLGCLLLVPPLRTLVYAWLARHVEIGVGGQPGTGFGAGQPNQGGSDDTIDLDPASWRRQ